MRTRQVPQPEGAEGSGDRFASTCWTMVRAAAEGEASSRETFAWRYEPVVRAYLKTRWQESSHLLDVDDAMQEVFLECFREGGALTRASSDTGSRFRTFLFAVTRNVGRRIEERAARRWAKIGDQDPKELKIPSDDEPASRAFDRAWAGQLIRQARELLETRAEEQGERAIRRTRLLRLRFYDGMQIAEIARQWGVKAAHLHKEYAAARREFAKVLREVVAFHEPGAPDSVERECARLESLFEV